MMLPLLAFVAAQGFDPGRLAAIPPRMRQFVDAKTVAGTVVMVTRNGKTVMLDAQGYANLETRAQMRTDTIFQIMSMTKPITAMAVVMCAEMGLLNLDDPIEKHLPSFRGLRVKSEDGRLVEPNVKPTLRHLMTHTAGYSGNDPGGLDDDGKRLKTLAEYAELLGKEPLSYQPGTQIRYSGPGFAALGRVVEVVSGMPFERFCQERMFAPLKLKDTFFFAPESVYDRLAYGYFEDNGKLVPIEPNPFRRGARFANPAGGLYSTAADMATLLGSMIGGKTRLLSTAGIDAMTGIQSGNLLMDGNDAQGFGLGWAVVRSPAGQMSLKPIGSFGHTGAYGTEFWADRKKGIVVVFMAQGFGNASEVRKTFNTMVNAAFVGP